ncbi:voltage-dependent T-type calcium channel subunit alpha-1I [Ischnura elegans]|uniref:voltage-dependent T-type calcium channel subunit alpha-1I n=1 Tax=Ischnura elegans TaxID=197161 RepID=UPI001ED8B30D|nr:voltage-dependent T-type calcium channel subunit alpha-1I [Ischnura elegans]
MMAILLNCVTLGMYRPCVDDDCTTNRCKILQIFDDLIFAFFAIEMVIKMLAMGVYGKGTYLADTWNRLDFFIVIAGALEYCLNVENMNLSAIRTIRVLRPLRAINRIPSMRILVMLLLDTLPMLGNVLLLCFFVFFIFGIVGVQLWEGILRQRCFLAQIPNITYPQHLQDYFTMKVKVTLPLASFYRYQEQDRDYICSRPDDNGMHTCSDLPPTKENGETCNGSAIPNVPGHSASGSAGSSSAAGGGGGSAGGSNVTTCINWNQYYSECKPQGNNPFQGAISFDNIGLAWVAIFLVISLEGWTDIMYYIQDAHSFWDWIYFVLLIVIGSFFMINLCLVVIATQFSETKKREMERMRMERARFHSTSTLASTNNSEPSTCYAEIVKYIAHLWRRGKRKLIKKYRIYKYRNRKEKEEKQGGGDSGGAGGRSLGVHQRRHHHGGRRRRRRRGAEAPGPPHLPPPGPQGTLPPPVVVVLGGRGGGGNGGGSAGGGGGEVEAGGRVSGGDGLLHAPTASPEVSDVELLASPRRPGLLRVPSVSNGWEGSGEGSASLLSPVPSHRRRSSVMFSDVVLLHDDEGTGAQRRGSLGSTGPSAPAPPEAKNVCSSEKMTQTGDGNVWQVPATQTTSTTLQVPLQGVGPSSESSPAPAPAYGSRPTSMTCQELLALSGALSAALPTQLALDTASVHTFFSSLSKGEKRHVSAPTLAIALRNNNGDGGQDGGDEYEDDEEDSEDDFTDSDYSDEDDDGSSSDWTSDSYDEEYTEEEEDYTEEEDEFDEFDEVRRPHHHHHHRPHHHYRHCYEHHRHHRKRKKRRNCCATGLKKIQLTVRKLVEHKYFQRGILFAILINTLSMGIEYHEQPEMLTAAVEVSNFVFSAIFAVEMMLKITAEGPFGYISNGFNVFDGVIVVLSIVELCQTFLGEKGGSSGLSVLRTFRLLRILKLVRFMPNLRRQLFVMLRTMDNVAVFFALLILFIFIFSILGMNLFGCKFCSKTDDGSVACDRKNFDSLLWAIVTVFQFCMRSDGSRECTCHEIVTRDPQCVCDRKHFNNILWATVTVFQILTQEDWNVVLFNGMEKTSHWAALYFVALMTFGNYVLFNLLVAILVEGFSAERNERMEREQRELEKATRKKRLEDEEAGGGEYCSHDTCRRRRRRRRRRQRRRRGRRRGGRRRGPDGESLSEESDACCGGEGAVVASGGLAGAHVGGGCRYGTAGTPGACLPDDEVLRKVKDNGNSWRLLQQQLVVDCEPKCNIQKENKMLYGGGNGVSRLPVDPPPLITHTAATPQDSPNTTLDTGFRDFGGRLTAPEALYASSLSIDSIDRSSSSQCSIPGLLKPPPSKYVNNNLSPTPGRRVSLVAVVNHSYPAHPHTLSPGPPATGLAPNVSYPSTPSSTSPASSQATTPNPRREPTTSPPKMQRGYSWKLSKPSLRRRSSRRQSGSGPEGDEGVFPETDDVVLNNNSNNNNNYVLSPLHSHCNGGLLASIRNDTGQQGGSGGNGGSGGGLSSKGQPSSSTSAPNNSNQLGVGSFQPASALSPQSSIRSRHSFSCHPAHSSRPPSVVFSTTSFEQQPAWGPVPRDRLARQNSLCEHSRHHRPLSQQHSNVSSSSYPISAPSARADHYHHHHPHHYYHHHHHRNSLSAMVAAAAAASSSDRNSKNFIESPHASAKADDDLGSGEMGVASISGYAVGGGDRSAPGGGSGVAVAAVAMGAAAAAAAGANGAAPGTASSSSADVHKMKKIFVFFEPRGCLKERDDHSLFIFAPDNSVRQMCIWFVKQKWFDNVVLLFIALNCITLAMERPNIPPTSKERLFLSTANYVFTVVFALEMFVKVIATGMLSGKDAYFTSGWNIMDGSLVIISIVDLLMSLFSDSGSQRIFVILRVFRLLRSLRPLRVINRAPGLKLVVQTLLSSLRPIGNIVLICCTFFIIFGILGVQLFKGAFYYCDGPDVKNVRNKTDCKADPRNTWTNRKYNFDDLGKALMSLFVLSSKDGWVNIMYTGLDAVGVDQQPIENYSEWRLLYFISFLLLVGFFVLNMFVGVVVENFHRCREEQEKEEKARRALKRAKQMAKKRRRRNQPSYHANYSKPRLLVHSVVTSKYFDLAIAAVIGLNVVTMAMEFYMMPKALTYALKIFNYFFTAVFILESVMKLVALGFRLYFKDRWNQLDVGIVILSIVGIVLEELESKIIPINPTIIRVMRVLRIARVLKLLKMAKGIRALLDTVMQALPQVGNLGLLFFLLFFIFAALGVELFGKLECSDKNPCQGLGEHAHFSNFGMAFLTLFRVATGDNWNGIMKDTLRDENCDNDAECVTNCCASTIIAPVFFVIFVLMAQFVLVNVVVAVLMKHLEESHKQMEDELDMECELERELAEVQDEEELVEDEVDDDDDDTDNGQMSIKDTLEMTLDYEMKPKEHLQLNKALSLPADFTFPLGKGSPSEQKESSMMQLHELRHRSASTSQKYSSQPRDCGRNELWERDTLSEILSVPPAYPATGYSVYPTDASAKSTINGSGAVYVTPREPSPYLPRMNLQKSLLPNQYSGICNTISEEVSKSTEGSSKAFLGLGSLQPSCSAAGDQSSPSDVSGLSPECTSPAVTLIPPPYPTVVMIPPSSSCPSPTCPYIPSSSSSSTSSPSSSYSHSRNSPCISPQEGEISLVVPDITFSRSKLKGGAGGEGKSCLKRVKYSKHSRNNDGSGASGSVRVTSSSSSPSSGTPSPCPLQKRDAASQPLKKQHHAGQSKDNSFGGDRQQESVGEGNNNNRVLSPRASSRQEEAPFVVTKTQKPMQVARTTWVDGHSSVSNANDRVTEGSEGQAGPCSARKSAAENGQGVRTVMWQGNEESAKRDQGEGGSSDDGSQEDLNFSEDRRRLC